MKLINGSDRIGSESHLWGPGTKTLLAYSNATYKHIHNSSYVIPDDCTMYRASTNNDVNTFGDFIQLIASTPVVLDFHWISIVNTEATANHILEFHIIDGAGASVQYLGAVSFTRTGAQVRSFQLYTQCPVIPAGVRVGARVKNNNAASADWVDFTLTYHDYQ
jgi:hypothetical protein